MAKAATASDNVETLPTPANNSLPANADFSAFDTGDTGFENVTASDLIIPRLTILQGLSPQVSRGKPEYDPEAKVGDVYDIGLQERFPDGITFIPAYFSKAYLEWAPRETGRGLQHVHTDGKILDQTHPDEKGKPILDNGNYISETSQIYGINVTAGFRPCFLPMVSTQLKKARRLLTLANTEKLQRSDGTEFTPPLWYRAYILTTVPESKDTFNWMGWKIERGQALTEFPNWQQHLATIKAFRESLINGETRGDLSGVEGEQSKQHEDIPF